MECKNIIHRVVAIVILCMGFMMANVVSAQTTYKTVNNKTYVFDNNKKVIYNQAHKSKASQFFATEGFNINNPSIVSKTFKQILSADRRKELKKERLAVVFECNRNGKIESVKFLFTTTPFLTATEVEQLEKAFLNQSFTVTSNLGKDQDIKFAIPCFFSKIQ
nr:unnamed protein product [uncultured bacterium]